MYCAEELIGQNILNIQGNGFIDDFSNEGFLTNIINTIGPNNYKLFAFLTLDFNITDEYLLKDIKSKWQKLDRLTGNDFAVIACNTQYISFIEKKKVNQTNPSIIFINYIKENDILKINFYKVITLRKLLPVSIEDLESLFSDISTLTKKNIIDSMVEKELTEILNKHEKFDVKITEVNFSDIKKVFMTLLPFLGIAISLSK